MLRIQTIWTDRFRSCSSYLGPGCCGVLRCRAAAVVARSMNRYLSFTRIGAAAAVRASVSLFRLRGVRLAHRCQSEELVSI